MSVEKVVLTMERGKFKSEATITSKMVSKVTERPNAAKALLHMMLVCIERQERDEVCASEGHVPGEVPPYGTVCSRCSLHLADSQEVA